jgi:hypothetical protein
MSDNNLSKPQGEKRRLFRSRSIKATLPAIFMIGLIALLTAMQYVYAGTTP